MDYTARVAAVVAGRLDPGEAVLAATPGAPRGSMRAIAYGNRRRHTVPGRSELRALGVADARQYVIVLSDRRFVWFRTSFTGRPNRIAGWIARGEVGEVVLGRGRILGQAYGDLRFVCRDGRRCGFEVARLHLALAETLVEAFHGPLTQGGSPAA